MAEKVTEIATVEPAMPLYNEASPGLGRNSRVVEEMRRQDAGGGIPLSDDPSDNPVRNDEPFRITSK